MFRPTLWISSVSLLAAVLVVTGCAKTSSTDEETGPGNQAQSAGSHTHDGDRAHNGDQSHNDDHPQDANHAHEGDPTDPAVTEALAKLSPEDRAAAEKQRVCPVSGAALGSMGTPLKVRVKDQDVFLCCAGCEDTLLANPDKYLAKLKR